MKISRQIKNDNVIVTRFGRLHTYQDAAEALEELLEINSGNDSIYEIVINDDDIKLQFTKEEEQLLIKKVESVYSKFLFGALAIVAAADFVFGMSRFLENFIENERIAITVFRTEAVARDWIEEIKELHGRQRKTKIP